MVRAAFCTRDFNARVTCAAVIAFVAAAPLLWSGATWAAAPYYPPPGDDWARKEPAAAGFDADKLAEAVRFSQEHETTAPRELEIAVPMSNAGEPHNAIIGPTKTRGGNNGLILRDGYIVTEWGDTRRVDMTFSVTKTYLSAVAGLAADRGMIRDVHDRVAGYAPDAGFESEHNAKITWHMLLNQTSEWEGTLWGKPDWADRWQGTMRTLHEPGTHWQYNDVRVNQLSLALLQIWRRPLPQVLREHVMDPIGASPTWRWHGYENSWVTLDGQRMQSVSGGGHWGGGMWISSRDHARFGLLCLRRGRWGDRQLLSEDWIKRSSTPTDIKPSYGYMNWFLNGKHETSATAPETSIFFFGAGANMVWLDPDHDLVAVVRWIEREHVDGFVERVLAALNEREQRAAEE